MGLLVAGAAISSLDGGGVSEAPNAHVTDGSSTGSEDDRARGRSVATSACDADDRSHPAPVPFGDVQPPAPRAIARAELFDLGSRTVALQSDGPPTFAELDASSGTWNCLPDAPVTGPRTAVAGPGRLLAISAGGAALFDASTDGWTEAVPLPDAVSGPPLGGVWTGTRFVLVWPSETADDASRAAAFSPLTGRWSDLADPPFPVNRAYNTALARTGSRVALFGTRLGGLNDPAAPNAQLALYDPEPDTWEQLPDSPLSPQAADLVAVGRRLVAVDYEQQSARLDLATSSWSGPAPTSLQASECPPQLVASSRHVTVVACSQVAFLDVPTRRWSTLAGLDPLSPVSLAGVIDDRVYLWWSPDERADGSHWQLVAIDAADP